MDRRQFFTRLGLGVFGTLMASRFAWAVPASAKYWTANQLMTKAWNDYTKGISHAPTIMLVSTQLADAFRSEMRVLSYRTNAARPFVPVVTGLTGVTDTRLLFKTCRVLETPYLDYWLICFSRGELNEDRTAMLFETAPILTHNKQRLGVVTSVS